MQDLSLLWIIGVFSGSGRLADLNQILAGTINTGKDQANIGYDQFYLTIKHSLNTLLSH